MLKIEEEKLQAIFEGMQSKTILVIGDLMLDHYIWGNMERISPEAPVPVVDVQEEKYRLGGAGNVASNLLSLGASVIISGIRGSISRETPSRASSGTWGFLRTGSSSIPARGPSSKPGSSRTPSRSCASGP